MTLVEKVLILKALAVSKIIPVVRTMTKLKKRTYLILNFTVKFQIILQYL